MATVTVDRAALLAQYDSSQPLYARLQDEVQFILKKQLADAKIPIHAIEHRVKSLESIMKKAEREELSDPIDRLNDILGLTDVGVIRITLQIVDEAFRKIVASPQPSQFKEFESLVITK